MNSININILGRNIDLISDRLTIEKALAGTSISLLSGVSLFKMPLGLFSVGCPDTPCRLYFTVNIAY
jgi:hypothetical protein